VRLNGHVPQVISTPDLDQIINAYSTVSDATGFAYKIGGHPFYQLNFASADASWLFDALSNRWTPVKSSGMGRHRGEIGIQYLSRTIVSDSSNGRLYKLNPATFTENGAAIEVELISETVRAPDGERFPVDRLRIDMETGVGATTGQGVIPQVMLSVSRDGGNTWGAEMWANAGELGKYKTRVEWRRLGTSDQWTIQGRGDGPGEEGLRLGVYQPARLMPNDLIGSPPMRDQVDSERGVTTPWAAWFWQSYHLLFALGQSGTTAKRPTDGLWVGRTYFDTTLGKPIWYSGTGWIKADGTAA
jgi:hypothetical protein